VNPLVTIMVPVHNGERTVARAVGSALAEPFDSLEVVVADDASEDGTESVVRAFLDDPRVRYLRRERRLGRVGNYRQTLYHDARGRYVLNLDGDDWLLGSSFLADAVPLLEADARRVLAIGQQATYYEAEQRTVHQARPYPLPTVVAGETIVLCCADGLRIPHLAALYRREDACAMDFFRRDVLWSDAESLLRLALNRHVVVLDHVVGVWRIHGDNASHGSDSPEHCFETFDLIDAVHQAAIACGALPQAELDAWRDRCKADFAYAFVVDHLKSFELRTVGRYLRDLRGRAPDVLRRALLDPRRPLGTVMRRMKGAHR
jgi:glycosyltransferase involved in cell wall biosynthesis